MRRVHKHYLVAWSCSHAMLYLASDTGLQHLTFKSTNLENRKISTPVGIMNRAGSNRKSVMNSVGMFNDVDTIDSNTTVMDNISCEGSLDEQCFKRTVPGVWCHPKFPSSA